MVSTGGGGGGVALSGGDTRVLFSRNIVACNTSETSAGADGTGGLRAHASSRGVVVEGNTIFANQVLGTDAGSGGVELGFSAGNALDFLSNVVAYSFGGGVKCVVQVGANPVLECNDIHGNSPDFVGTDCGEVWGVNGNFNADPMFGAAGCPPTEDDFCLQPGSPLLPENSPPGCGLIGARGPCPWVGLADPGAPGSGSRQRLLMWPNPFGATATIEVAVPDGAVGGGVVVNVRGEVVAALAPGAMRGGRPTLTWDGSDGQGGRCPAGVYFVRVPVGGETLGGRVILFR